VIEVAADGTHFAALGLLESNSGNVQMNHYSKCRLLSSLSLLFALLTIAGMPAICSAQDSGADVAGAQEQEGLAKQLANPIASLISVPMLLEYEQDIGPADDGDRLKLTIQPVIPFKLNEKWNLISRTILSVVDQSDIFPGSGSQSGLSDTLQSLFFSPQAPTSGGWIWGVGPAISLPTGSDDLLTSDKWGLGPTAVALKQNGPLTVGVLANHIWSVAGDDDRADVNSTLVEPFMTYTTPQGSSYTAFADFTNDWETDQSSIAISLGATKVTRLGNQLVSYGGFVKYWVDDTNTTPEGVSFRIQLTLLYPKR